MAHRRLGVLVLALVIAWSVTGLDWHPNSPAALAPSLASPAPAYAADRPDFRGTFGTLGDPDDIADTPNYGGDPDTTATKQEGGKNESSLLLRIIDAVGTWFGLKK